MSEEIVITGMSGRFPESESVAEFSQNLFNKVDMVTENSRRWEPGQHGLPRRMGVLKDISKFDNNYFGIDRKHAHLLDPQSRILLELTHESIVDAGYDPEDLRGRNIGVFIGSSMSESEIFFTRDANRVEGYSVAGCSKGMFASRISLVFDFKGPSFTMDTACSSGVLALYQAVRAIKNNECEAAIVGGSHICLRPGSAVTFLKLSMISDEGKCRSFDASGNGYARSEAIATLFIQKSNMARRKYATIIHIKTNTDGYKEQGVTFPSATMQQKLMAKVYDECHLNPLQVSYVEAHGTGTPAGDPVEMSAISEIFCPGREGPLLVGAVKSNMGHPEPASGICSIVKVLIAMEAGMIPPNLHFCNPNPTIPSLMDGRVKIVTDSTPWEGGYAAVSSFGFGGANLHLVLKSNNNPPIKTEANVIPQLVLYSGRTHDSVQHLFNYVDELPSEAPARNFFTLLHKSVYSSIQTKPFRGYKLLAQEQDIEDIKKVSSEKRQVWYIFSGVGSQWTGMAKYSMDMEVFASSIMRSAEVIKPYGLDLIKMITTDVKHTSNTNKIVSAVVSIAAIQIALVDVLNEIGLQPDGMIGHSVGELGCAYADGSLTAEQMVLAAYWCSKSIGDHTSNDCTMVEIGLTWSQASKRCPKDVFPACHNAENSVTVAGPKDSVERLVKVLKSEGTYTREVDTCGFTFHCEHIAPALEKIQSHLKEIIQNPKPRSGKWISSSYSESHWNDPSTQMSSPSYFVHNIGAPVLFHDAVQHIPEDAILIEIAPHDLLLSSLKGSLSPDVEFIGLMKKNANNTVRLLSKLGRLYTAGLNPKIEKLYPNIQFPVARSTPMISPIIKWDHSETWTVPLWDICTKRSIVVVNVASEDRYLLGHCIDGRCLYPVSGYLVMVWNAFANMKGKETASLPVTFEEVKIHITTVLSKTESIKFHVGITSVEGEFEITKGETIVCTGRIFSSEKNETQNPIHPLNNMDTETAELKQKDIYKELKLRGYNYGPTFQGILASDLDGNQGILKWTGDWVVFLNTMLQFSILGSQKRALYLPTRIQSLKIDPNIHNTVMEDTMKEFRGIPVIHERNSRRCIAGGVEMKNLKISFDPRRHGEQIPVLEEYHFVPYNELNVLSKSGVETLEKYIDVCSSIAKVIMQLKKKSKDEILSIMKEFKEADDSVITSFLKSNTDCHVLLETLFALKIIATRYDFKQLADTYVNNYVRDMSKDILFQTMEHEVPLRTVLDVFLENVASRKLTVAEATNSTVPLCTKLHKFTKIGSLNMKYIIAHSKPDSVDKECLSSGEFDLVSWDTQASLKFKDIDLFVIKFLNCNIEEYKRILANASTTLKNEGFVLVLQKTRLVPAEKFLSSIGNFTVPILPESDLEYIFKDSNLRVICKKSDSLTSTLYLLRKFADVPFEDYSIPIVEDKSYQWVNQLKEKMVEVQASVDSKRIWLVSEGFDLSGIVGLVNCLRKEPGGASIRCVSTNTGLTQLPKFSLKTEVYQDILDNNLVMNVFQNGKWGSFRHIKMSGGQGTVETSHACLNVLTRGDLSSLTWVDSPMKYFKQTDKSILCQVYYAPLNVRDIMLSSGKLPLDAIPGDLDLMDCILGLEFSGRLKNGHRVMGMVYAKGLATTVAADLKFMWNVPDKWTLEEASTVPVAYSTAYYALVVRGNLKKGEMILIHSGSGDVGQAAISIALSLECEVFTSVGSSEKREFLKKRFPTLQDRNFCYSRDTSFEQYVLASTNGEGVDVVLNSLAEEKLKASLNCLAQHGRFLEIGKTDLSNNTILGMAIFLKNISFHGIILDALFENKSYSSRVKKEVVQLVKDGIADGTVTPLHSILFNHDEAEQAFRFMANGKNIGKVVLKIKEEEVQMKIVPSPTVFKALSRTTCDPYKSYVIIGGLGELGLELCQWLVDRGAKNIVLTSQTGLQTGYQRLCLDRWKKNCLNVLTSQLNAAKLKETEALLEMAAMHGPVGAIFNLALNVRAAFIENQTAENFVNVCEPKVTTAINLDVLSRKLCPALQWFVCFSSVSCGRGNPSQSSHGYVNSIVERICEKRSKDSLPGLAIQWGAIGDVALAQDTVGLSVMIGGTIPQRIISCLSVLDKFLQQNHPVVSSCVPYEPLESRAHKTSKKNVMSKHQGHIVMNPEVTLGELGMDRRMGTEVKQFLQRDLDLVLAIPKLRPLKIKDIQKLEYSAFDINSNPQSKSLPKN